jgi:poly-D-alanine transfer protein DltD|tara:strand:+ start:236 stop:694 length:459 start_codon:yes stop_codon:yes gene_type:complete
MSSEEDVEDVVGDLLEQLKGTTKVKRDLEESNLNLSKENLEDFLLQYSGKLIKGSVDYVEDVKQFITSAPDSKDLEALSKLVGASAAAIESLNKIHISNKSNENKKEIKQMDIESKRELQNNNNQLLGLTLNREELLKKLLNDAEIIDAEVS